MIGRPSLLVMTAVAAGLATVANAVGLAGADEAAAPAKITSRLGVAIADDTSARDQAATRRGRTLDLREQAVRAAEMAMVMGSGALRWTSVRKRWGSASLRAQLLTSETEAAAGRERVAVHSRICMRISIGRRGERGVLEDGGQSVSVSLEVMDSSLDERSVRGWV